MSYKVEATVDGIKFLYDGGEVEVTYDVSDSDVVRLTIEPLEVKVTDGFRAAVKKACKCDSSSGGGSGGGPSSGDAPLLVEILEGPANDAKSAPNTKSSPQQHHLSKTASEIWDANVVVAMLDCLDDTEETGNIYYSDLWDKEIHAGQKSATRADGYYFMFESGDEFYAATADDYPVLSGELKIGTTTPGSGGGGSGGGVLVVHESATTEGATTTLTLDATYADIVAAGFCVIEYVNDSGLHNVYPLSGYGSKFGNMYSVFFGSTEYSTDSENGYPAHTEYETH